MEESILNTEDLSKQISDPGIDLAVDYAEIGLDDIIQNPILKELPIVKSLVAAARIGFAIKERFFVKKFLNFLKEFHTGKISQKKFDEFKERFEHDHSYREKITEQIVILNDSYNSISKSKILAHLFKAHIEGIYDWNRFLQLGDCLNKLQDAGYVHLTNFAALSPHPFVLQGKGVNLEGEALMFSAGIGYRNGTMFTITDLGKELYKHGISKI